MGYPKAGRAVLLLLGAAALSSAFSLAPTDAAADEFSSGTINLGIVVSDVDESVAFYTELVGMEEVPGFTVSAEFCTHAGLTDGQPLKIRVLVPGKDPKATNLKLMEVPGVTSKEGDNRYVHSQLGFSYLTIRVKSLKPALKRLKAAGIEPLAKGPVPLPGAGADGPHLAVVRDPDGNMLELIGPVE